MPTLPKVYNGGVTDLMDILYHKMCTRLGRTIKWRAIKWKSK